MLTYSLHGGERLMQCFRKKKWNYDEFGASKMIHTFFSFCSRLQGDEDCCMYFLLCREGDICLIQRFSCLAS